MESAITVKGQATIPKAIREHLRLQPGDRVKFFVHPDGSVVLLPKLPPSALRGIFKAKRRAVTVAEMNRAVLGRCGRRPIDPWPPMIGLDTNVIVRYLTQDDPLQSRIATEILRTPLTPQKPGFICVVTMVETVWVLDRAYGLTAQEIAGAVERMLQTEVLLIENEQEVFTAMIALKEGRGSFADALIAALGAKAGCKHTLTFRPKGLAVTRLSARVDS